MPVWTFESYRKSHVAILPSIKITLTTIISHYTTTTTNDP